VVRLIVVCCRSCIFSIFSTRSKIVFPLTPTEANRGNERKNELVESHKQGGLASVLSAVGLATTICRNVCTVASSSDWAGILHLLKWPLLQSLLARCRTITRCGRAHNLGGQIDSDRATSGDPCRKSAFVETVGVPLHSGRNKVVSYLRQKMIQWMDCW
jgi:hypothetical protein